MTTSTEQKVINAARECFFHHGYKASNMTLISEFAGLSRATTHKYARNKEDAFRLVCQEFANNAQATCLPIQDGDLHCWEAIEVIIDAWLKPSFDEVSDIRVLNDLKYHAQVVAEDVFTEARQKMEDMICTQLEKGVKRNQISLDSLSFTCRDFAKLMLASLTGLRGHYDKSSITQASNNTLRIFKQACQVTR